MFIYMVIFEHLLGKCLSLCNLPESSGGHWLPKWKPTMKTLYIRSCCNSFQASFNVVRGEYHALYQLPQSIVGIFSTSGKQLESPVGSGDAKNFHRLSSTIFLKPFSKRNHELSFHRITLLGKYVTSDDYK